MSLHKSLRVDRFKNKKRSVRKRHERIRSLMLQQKFDRGDSIFGLPKEKIFRMKVVKAEKKKVETDLTKLV
jgi:small basic protein (TIGR04137 family)